MMTRLLLAFLLGKIVDSRDLLAILEESAAVHRVEETVGHLLAHMFIMSFLIYDTLPLFLHMSLRVCYLFGSCLLFLEGLHVDVLMLHLPRILVAPVRGLGVVVDAGNFLGVGCIILLTVGPVLEAVVLVEWQRLPRLLVGLLLFRCGLSRFLRRLRESIGCI